MAETSDPLPSSEPPSEPTSLSAPGVHVSLAPSPLSMEATTSLVRSPKAGAIVVFAGTTRDSFASKPVKSLTYTSYAPLALRTMLHIAEQMKGNHGLQAIAMVHRLGTVPIGEESILIAVSSPHRQAAWRAGEEALELVKEKVEIWKLEEFEGDEGGVWRANRDGAMGERVDEGKTASS